MTLQRILGAAALTLIITGAYAATSDPGDVAMAQSTTAQPAAAPSVAASSTTPDQGG